MLAEAAMGLGHGRGLGRVPWVKTTARGTAVGLRKKFYAESTTAPRHGRGPGRVILEKRTAQGTAVYRAVGMGKLLPRRLQPQGTAVGQAVGPSNPLFLNFCDSRVCLMPVYPFKTYSQVSK